MKISEYFGKFWYVSFLCIGILIFYSLLLTVGTFYLTQNYLGPGTSNPSSGFVVQLSIISEKENEALNKTFIDLVSENTSLINVINNTVGDSNFDFIDYGVSGLFITSFYSVDATIGWDWLLYYKPINSTSNEFIYSPIGVSHFRIENHYEVRFIFTKNG